MAYIYDMVATWTAVGTTYTGIKLNVTDTASAAESLLQDLQVGGTSKGRLKKNGELGILSLGFAASDANVPDIIITRDAANTLALRNGVNAQLFNIYNTYTDASNYEKLSVGFSANIAYFSTGNAGTGVARGISIGAAGTQLLLFTGGTSTQGFRVVSGHFLAGVHNTYDVGQADALSPRSIYFGTSIFRGSTKILGAQGAAVADATDAATAITQLNALLARVRAHGLIA